MRKSILLVGVSCGFILAFAVGAFWGENKIQETRTFHANTVGMQIVEINRLYEKMNANGLPVTGDWEKYNRDMLLLIDCGRLMDGLEGTKSDSSLKPFFEGLNISWKMLKSRGITKGGLGLCSGRVKEWLND